MAFELVETITSNGSATGVVFDNIPQDAIDLVMYVSNNSAGAQFRYQINDSTGYKVTRLRGTGTSEAILYNSGSNIYFSNGGGEGAYNGGAAKRQGWSNLKISWADYQSSNQKTMNWEIGGSCDRESVALDIGSIVTDQTSAITKIELSGGTWLSGSTASLYKIY